MALKYTNNASTTLSANITTSATSITVADASEFPAIGAGDYTYITFATADASKIEIVKVTGRSSDTFTVVRAQDNTTAQAFSSGDLCELRITAKLMEDALDSIVQGISDRKDYTVGTTALPYAGSTTVFPVSYDTGFIDVFLNGVRLDPSDFTATNNNNVTLSSAAASGDVVTCIGWGTFQLSNTAINDLNNVNVPSPTNGQALTYDTSTSKWVASATYTHPTGAGNEHLPSSVSQTEAGYLDGVTSAIQTQIDTKQSASADYDVGDNVKIKLGASDDLQIYHDGLNSRIKDVGTGNLLIQGTQLNLQNATETASYINCLDGGSVKINHNDITRMETTSTGIDVTGSVTATAEVSTPHVTLDAIDASITGNAVDIFIYDTSKDSDGGAWRKRTQHTSWYNEASSSTRSSRKEFPAVAVIILTNTSWDIAIYDGDDPSLPLWRKFDLNANASASIAALNGEIWITDTGTFPSLGVINLLKDWVEIRDDRNSLGVNRRFYDPITASSVDASSNRTTINNVVNHIVNDVAMTVLPNAPIDSVTGLPIPTIAVATDDGVSVIKDDGTVVDLNRTNDDSVSHVFFDKHNRVHMWMALGAVYVAKIPSSDESGNPHSNWTVYRTLSSNAPASAIPMIKGAGNGLGMVSMGDVNAYSGSNSDNARDVTLLREDMSDSTKGSVAYITSKYNTGYMTGDIRGAWNVDTDVTALSGSGTNVFSGSWTNHTSSFPYETFTTSGIDITSAINTTSYGACYITYVPVIGKTYTVKFDLVLNSGVGPRVFVQSGSSFGNGVEFTAQNGSNSFTWTATVGTSSYFNISVSNGVSTNFAISNFNLYQGGIPDRSVKGNGLAVHGTPTVSAVASGAELKCISGFSSSNYLKQPYNSDLDFDASDTVSMSAWFKTTSNSTSQVVMSFGEDANQKEKAIFIDSTGHCYYVTNGYGSSGSAVYTEADNGAWTYVCIVSHSSNSQSIYINGFLDHTASLTELDFTTNEKLYVGLRMTGILPFNGSIALPRISATAPTAEQIKEIYEAEKPMFQANAKCTLNGSSDAVTALAYDDSTELLHVGTSGGRSAFQGLRRVAETSTSTTEIAAQGGLIVEET